MIFYNTNPTSLSTDGDTYSDRAEVDAGTDPKDPVDHPTTTTGPVTTETSTVFVPECASVELVLALVSLVMIVQRRTKRER